MIATDEAQPALIDCQTAARALYDFLDARLPGATMASVQHHIDLCAACASHFDFARRVLALLPSAVPLEPECEALRTRIVDAIARDAAGS
jgi:hypothetical protein